MNRNIAGYFFAGQDLKLSKSGNILVLFFDGTSNEFGGNNTNIVKMYKALRKDIPTQRAFYDPGIGTMGPSDWAAFFGLIHKVLGLVTGYGISENIKDGYRYLMENLDEDDEIYIFGFSRGAYTARSLAGMVGKVGVLDEGLPNMVDYAYKMYSDERNHKFANDFKNTYSRRKCNVKFIGVFDTVGALIGAKTCMVAGIIIAAIAGYFSSKSVFSVWKPILDGWEGYVGLVTVIFLPNYIGRFIQRTLLGNHQFHNTKLSPTVEYGYHALAIDEYRWLFRPTRWDTSEKLKDQKVEQVWFSGVHVDVGGFNTKNSGTSDNALAWMIHHSKAAGLQFDDASIETKPSASSALSLNHWGWSLVGSVSRLIHKDDSVHISVEARKTESPDEYEISRTIMSNEKYDAKPTWYQRPFLWIGRRLGYFINH